MQDRHHEVRRPGSYSADWFRLFLDRIAPEVTQAEVAFLRSCLPLPEHRRLLDVCCGPGRHAALLSSHGHDMTGIDADAAAIERARASDPRGHYFCADVRELSIAEPRFDAVVCMWASFGWFDGATNRDVLRRMTEALRPGGRLVLDVYHRGFFERPPYRRIRDQGGTRVIESVRLENRRLKVRLQYLKTDSAAPGVDEDVRESDVAASDHFEWDVWTPDELVMLATTVGLVAIVRCSGFDVASPPSAHRPRMQFVFHKTESS